MKIIWQITSAFILISTGNVWAKSPSTPTPSETHEFHISAKASYRCYAGYDGKKVTDERTKEICDNKTYNSTIVDKVIAIKIVDESDPEDSKDLAGSWSEEFKVKGRKFVIAVSLFKENSQNPYRIRILAKDDEPSARETVVFSELKTVPEMNSLSIEYTSMGKKEEITYWTDIQPSAKK